MRQNSLLSWWKTVVGGAHRAQATPTRTRKPRLQFEHLESRRVLATLTVTNLTNTGAGSLRGQIAAAAAGDTINFQTGLTGTIALTSELALNKNLSIVGPTGNASIAVSGSSRGRVFNIGQGKTIDLSNLTVRDGLVFGLTIQGGGIENAGNLTLNNCTITNNGVISGFFAGFGAGIDNNHGSLTLNNCTVRNNTLQVTGSTVSVQAYGGGIYSSGALTMTGCTVSGNQVTGTESGAYINNAGGGGIAFGGAAGVLTNCTIAGNSVTASGGSSISAGGGGICFLGSSGSLTVTNSTLSGNTSTSAGGSAQGGGLCTDGGALSLLNSIVASNIAGSGPDIFGTISSLGNNLISNTSGSNGFGAADLRNVAANLAALANNGGPTQTMALMAGSPAIDAGKNSGAPGLDERGVARPQNGVVDIGAYEVSSTNSSNVTLTPTTLPNGTEAATYSQLLSASGGTAPYTFAVSSGALPGGLTLSSGGVLSGAPSNVGSFTFTIRATATGGASGTQAYTMSIGSAAIAISPTTLANGTEATPYSQTLTASGGTGSYTFALLSGALPTGLTLSPAGVLSGTPTAIGAFSFTVQATSSGGSQGSRAYTATISAATITVNPATLPNAAEATPYNQTMTASGGIGPYAFAISSGALPGGLTLTPAGLLSGTPTTNGTFSFTVRASGANSTGTRAYSLVVNAATVTVNPSTFPNGAEGAAYSQTLSATGSAAPYTFSLLSGALPGGLTLSSAGVLSGTATTIGTFNFAIKATSATSAAGVQAYTMSIGAATVNVTPASLASGTEGTTYSQSLAANGGIGPYAYAISAGALPGGLTLSSAGILSGTATTVGSFNFTVTATSSGGSTAAKSYTVAVNPAAITVNPASLPGGTSGTAYSQTITSTGGFGSRTFAVTSGTLPSGLTLSSGGLLSGTPTAAGTFNFTIASTTSGGSTGSRAFTLSIVAAPSISLTPATLPGGTAQAAYSQTLAATGGSGSYTFAVTGGALPTGFTLAANGVLSGTTLQTGTFNFTITATDSLGAVGARAYALTIAGTSTIAITPATLPPAWYGVAYTQSLAATGGVGPYQYTVTSGRLPTGLTLSSTGVLSGTPTQTGTFNITIAATDGTTTGSRTYSFAVNFNFWPT